MPIQARRRRKRSQDRKRLMAWITVQKRKDSHQLASPYQHKGEGEGCRTLTQKKEQQVSLPSPLDMKESEKRGEKRLPRNSSSSLIVMANAKKKGLSPGEPLPQPLRGEGGEGRLKGGGEW